MKDLNILVSEMTPRKQPIQTALLQRLQSLSMAAGTGVVFHFSVHCASSSMNRFLLMKVEKKIKILWRYMKLETIILSERKDFTPMKQEEDVTSLKAKGQD